MKYLLSKPLLAAIFVHASVSFAFKYDAGCVGDDGIFTPEVYAVKERVECFKITSPCFEMIQSLGEKGNDALVNVRLYCNGSETPDLPDSRRFTSILAPASVKFLVDANIGAVSGQTRFQKFAGENSVNCKALADFRNSVPSAYHTYVDENCLNNIGNITVDMNTQEAFADIPAVFMKVLSTKDYIPERDVNIDPKGISDAINKGNMHPDAVPVFAQYLADYSIETLNGLEFEPGKMNKLLVPGNTVSEALNKAMSFAAESSSFTVQFNANIKYMEAAHFPTLKMDVIADEEHLDLNAFIARAHSLKAGLPPTFWSELSQSLHLFTPYAFCHVESPQLAIFKDCENCTLMDAVENMLVNSRDYFPDNYMDGFMKIFDRLNVFNISKIQGATFNYLVVDFEDKVKALILKHKDNALVIDNFATQMVHLDDEVLFDIDSDIFLPLKNSPALDLQALLGKCYSKTTKYVELENSQFIEHVLHNFSAFPLETLKKLDFTIFPTLAGFFAETVYEYVLNGEAVVEELLEQVAQIFGNLSPDLLGTVTWEKLSLIAPKSSLNLENAVSTKEEGVYTNILKLAAANLDKFHPTALNTLSSGTLEAMAAESDEVPPKIEETVLKFGAAADTASLKCEFLEKLIENEKLRSFIKLPGAQVISRLIGSKLKELYLEEDFFQNDPLGKIIYDNLTSMDDNFFDSFTEEEFVKLGVDESFYKWKEINPKTLNLSNLDNLGVKAIEDGLATENANFLEILDKCAKNDPTKCNKFLKVVAQKITVYGLHKLRNSSVETLAAVSGIDSTAFSKDLEELIRPEVSAKDKKFLEKFYKNLDYFSQKFLDSLTEATLIYFAKAPENTLHLAVEKFKDAEATFIVTLAPFLGTLDLIKWQSDELMVLLLAYAKTSDPEPEVAFLNAANCRFDPKFLTGQIAKNPILSKILTVNGLVACCKGLTFAKPDAPAGINANCTFSAVVPTPPPTNPVLMAQMTPVEVENKITSTNGECCSSFVETLKDFKAGLNLSSIDKCIEKLKGSPETIFGGMSCSQITSLHANAFRKVTAGVAGVFPTECLKSMRSEQFKELPPLSKEVAADDSSVLEHACKVFLEPKIFKEFGDELGKAVLEACRDKNYPAANKANSYKQMAWFLLPVIFLAQLLI